MSFWAELSRRNVYKVGVAYLIVAWLLAQVASVVAPALSLPDWVTPLVVFLLVLGFPVALLLAWAYEVTPEGIKRTQHVPLAASLRHVTGQKLNYVVTGLLVGAVAFIAFDYYVLRGGSTESASEPAAVAAPGAPSAPAPDPGATQSAQPIVAVLPFDNLSPNLDDAYFASGLHDEILNQLAKIEAIKVISRTSVLRYAENRPPIPQIAAELNADAVMEGSVRYAGDRILVTAQLIDPATDTHLWTQTYPGDLSDLEQIFAIQADIAMNVANALEAELSPEDRTSLARRPTASREAYELYLASLSEAQHARAIELLERALELDPNFAEAWARKGRVQVNYQALLPPERGTELRAYARRDALHAVELAPDSAAVRGEYAFVLTQLGEWIEAERAYRAMRAVGGDPTDVGDFFHRLSVGDFVGAKASTQSLVEKDPLNPGSLGFLLLSHGLLGETREETETYEKGTALFSDWFVGELAEFYFRLGRRDFEHVQTRAAASDAANLLRILSAYLDAPEAGLAEIRRLSGEASAYSSNVARVNLALWAAFFGNDELALSLASAALEESRVNTYWIWMPLFERMRRLPAFKTLVRDLGLVDYWREFGWPEICQPTQGEDFVCR